MMQRIFWTVLGLSTGWLLLRCRVGFHGPTTMERAQDANGRDDPHRVYWRCTRCFQRCGETTLKPDQKLRQQIYQMKFGNAPPMRRRA